MNDQLQKAYVKVTHKHYSAIQTDEALSHTDDYKPGLERKAKQFWADYEAANIEFVALLERCTLND